MKKQQTNYHGASSSSIRGITVKTLTQKKYEESLHILGMDATMSKTVPKGKFGVMFPELPGYSPSDEGLKQIAEIMREQSENSNNDSSIPLGFAFLGQFVDHDLTLEPVSQFDDNLDPSALVNFRTAALDLDSLYGPNPDVARHLYDTYGDGQVPEGEHRLPYRLLTENPSESIDLQRNTQGTAIIGDPRNDENLFISQLHRRIIGFHNEVVKYLENEHAEAPLKNRTLFEEARKIVTLHYHWIIIHEFLPLIIGKQLTQDILQNGRKFVSPLPTSSCQMNRRTLPSRHAKKSKIQQRGDVPGH